MVIPEPIRCFGKPIIIDNKSGAGGIIGTTEAARATPDGYTTVFGNLGPNALNASPYQKLDNDPVRDFAPISAAQRQRTIR
jgi:tripartite-type tricarboxylate transporter receptor subunit TctC